MTLRERMQPGRWHNFLLGFIFASTLWGVFLACKAGPSGPTPPVAAQRQAAPVPLPPPAPAPPASSPAPVPSVATVLPGVPNEGFAPMLGKVGPAVVNIQATKAPRPQDSPYGSDPFFRHFFGGRAPQPEERRERSLGSGVIVSPDGIILTNHHVIKDASEILISLADRREMRARVLGSDPKTDIAVIKVEGQGLPTLPFGDSRSVRVGDLAFAVGSPFGLAQTATFGIVSAVGRGDIGIVDYEDFIQTDAAINPGNSGGALVNARGELIGINTAILSRGAQGNQGVGFAVPAHMAQAVMKAIVTQGRVVRGYLGVSVQDLNPALSKAFRLPDVQGVLVAFVQEGSPAEKGGLQRGDLITAIDGNATPTARKLRLWAAATAPGTAVKVSLVRKGQPLEVPLRLADLPGEGGSAQPGPGEAPVGRSGLPGVELQTLTPRIAAGLNLPPSARGVLVVSVRPDSVAGQAGLRRGDVIFEANQHRVRSAEELAALARAAGGNLLLLVARGDHNLYVPIEP